MLFHKNSVLFKIFNSLPFDYFIKLRINKTFWLETNTTDKHTCISILIQNGSDLNLCNTQYTLWNRFWNVTVYQLLQNKLHENKESRVKRDANRFIEVPPCEYVLSSNSTLGTRFTKPVCFTISKIKVTSLSLPILLATIYSVWFSKLSSSIQSLTKNLQHSSSL